MTLTLTDLAILLIVAGICGAIGRAIAGGPPRGILVSIALGFIGALFGMWLARVFHLPLWYTLQIGDAPEFPIIWAIIGAAFFVAVLHLLSGGWGWRRRRYWW
jgi:uncharacterized membrane protein YeaQ/YmgE (transglycosylase-associated protein family)